MGTWITQPGHKGIEFYSEGMVKRVIADVAIMMATFLHDDAIILSIGLPIGICDSALSMVLLAVSIRLLSSAKRLGPRLVPLVRLSSCLGIVVVAEQNTA